MVLQLLQNGADPDGQDKVCPEKIRYVQRSRNIQSFQILFVTHMPPATLWLDHSKLFRPYTPAIASEPKLS